MSKFIEVLLVLALWLVILFIFLPRACSQQDQNEKNYIESVKQERAVYISPADQIIIDSKNN